MKAQGTEELALETAFGATSIQDSVRSGIADMVAAHILSSIMKIVEPFSEGRSSEEAVKAAGLPGNSLEDLIAEMNRRGG